MGRMGEGGCNRVGAVCAVLVDVDMDVDGDCVLMYLFFRGLVSWWSCR